MSEDINKYSHGCTLDCADACKFEVLVDGEGNIKITGDKTHPYTKGFVCKKGLAHLTRLNHKDRIYSPMIKEKGKWKELSFEKALNIMAEKLSYYKKKHSSKSILFYEQYGSGSSLKGIANIFFNFYGGVTKSKGGPCWSAGMQGQKMDFGDARSHSLEDMLNSKNIFVWGKNPAYTTIHTMQMIKKAQSNGSKIIVIDPILTQTGKMADLFIRIKPGGDEALALAIGKIIIEELGCDKDFIDKYTNDFNRYKEYINSLSLNKLSQISGVNEEEIRNLAKLYSEKYSTILLGYGIQKYKNGCNTIRAIDALGAITGQIGFSGGGVNYANKVYPSAVNSDPYNSEINNEDRLFYVSHISDFILDSLKGETYYKDNIYIKEEKIKDSENIKRLNIPIKMAVITSSNLLNQLPNLNKLEEAMEKIEFKVCFDMFMTDTARACDLFIPCTNTLETEDIIYSSMTNPYITYNEKIKEPKNKLMDEYYFFRELAKIMEINNYPMVSKREYLNKIIKPLKNFDKNISLEGLKNKHFTIHDPIAWKDKEFKTKSSKFNFYNGEVDLKKVKDNGLRLLTNHGVDSLSSQHFLDNEEIAKAYINEETARFYQIKDKEVARIYSNNGEVITQINIDNNIGNDIIMMYVGWWKKNGNPNFLTNSGISDFGGQITYNETFVHIKKL
ncbi:molybdopterin-dependent oxidoreductase [Clostridium sp.]|uniref:molybdopterin-dependent oxidoreductase n=1 Tax=Clostridium sp. TaxID=1506 RepID=UPI003F38C4ED